MNKLSGLFYPYVTRKQVETLKVASIYFDEVYVLTPVSLVREREFLRYYDELPERMMREYGDDLGLRYARKETLQHESVLAALDFQRQAEPLIDTGVVRVVNPFDQMKSIGLENEFRTIIEYRARQASRRDISDTPGILEREAHEEGRIAVFAAQAAIAIRPRTRTDHIFDTARLLEARTGAIKSIMFDSAVLISAEFDAIPITGDALSDREFSIQATTGRYRSLADSFERHGWLREVEDHKATRELEGYEIMKESVLENVPCFAGATFKDILRLRQHCNDELSAFRQEVRKLAASISQGPLDEGKRKEILDIVSKEVNPIIDELERKIRLSRAQWSKRLLSKTTSINTLATLVSTVFVGIPLHYGLLAATAIAGIQAGLETYFEVKELKTSNGLSFILELRKIPH